MHSPRQSLADRVASALRELGTADSQTEMVHRVEALHQSYPAPVLLTAMLQLLPEADSQLQGGLGLLAQRLPRPVTEARLLQQVLNKDLSTQTRFSAVTILQDFLHRPVDPGFVQDISDVDSVILSSMQDAFAARSKFPGILIEYTEQFSQLESQHRTYVLGLLHHVRTEDAAELLQTMAYSSNREVGLQALEALATLEADSGERVLYILSQSLYLDPELSGSARQQLRKIRLQGGQYAPPALPHNSLARFLGFDKGGVAHWYLAHDAQPYGLLVGYGFRQGVQHLQKIPHDSDLDDWPQPRARHFECRYDWARWHLHYTLSRFPPDRKAGTYPESYQLWASELWQWQLPSEGAEALDMMRRSAPLDPADFMPTSIAVAITRLPYGTVLRDLIWREPEAPASESISLCTWFLNVCALAQWHRQRELSAVLAHTAHLLEQDAAMGGKILGALKEHWANALEQQ